MKHIEKTIQIESTPEKIFAFMDDIRHMGKHAMYGMEKSELEVINETLEVIGSKYRFRSSMLGIKMNLDVVVTKWIKNQEKCYQFSIGKFVFDIDVATKSINEKLAEIKVMVDYQVPDSLFGRFMDWLIIERYIKSEVEKLYERCLDILEKDKLQVN